MIEQPATHPHALMVYGTLKRAHGNSRILHHNKSIFVGECLTKDKVVVTEHFPTVYSFDRLRPHRKRFHETDKGLLRGELWYVNDQGLADCDRLEGHPRTYCREEVDVTMLDGTIVPFKPWLYFIRLQPTGPYVKPDANGHVEWLREEREPIDWDEMERQPWRSQFGYRRARSS